MLYLTAFITGLLGSFHCLGMCGPIALIAPVGQNRGQFVAGRLVYNSGRIFTYATIGLLIGAFGQGLQLAGIQQYISIITGVLLLLYAIVKITGIRLSDKNNTISAYSQRIQKLFAKFITKPGLGAQFAVGMINGLLPCGLVYLALAGAATTTHALQGAAFMALFGLGTLPMMLAVSFTSRWVTQGVRTTILKTIPYFVAVVAVLFIVRGMNLGVPYLSPKINTHNQMECCEKPQ
ncbi:MAG: sulfite exporter TauE/SafE family protein [Bacteroidetes bacterium]|nr:MAG: sulfite exporter TauE/SafE family protein [Bacteroidota bacterium]